jgi:hypothetical protein
MTDMDSDPKSQAYDILDSTPDSSGRHRFINRRTTVMLDLAFEKLGFKLEVIQGSYMPLGEAADASDATHNGGGVIDLKTDFIPADVGIRGTVLALRKIGFAAFHRTDPPFDQDHIHAVAIGDVQMDPTAKDQVDEYFRGLDGLGNTDTGPRPDPIPVFDYDTQGADMLLTDKIPGTDDKTVGDALRAALRTEQDLEQLSTRESHRAELRAARNQKLSERIAAVGHAVDDLPEGATKAQVKSLLEEMLSMSDADEPVPTP